MLFKIANKQEWAISRARVSCQNIKETQLLLKQVEKCPFTLGESAFRSSKNHKAYWATFEI